MAKQGVYNKRTEYVKKLEEMNGKSKVVRTVARPASQRIMDSLLSGALVTGGRMGYDFRADAELPESFNFADMRSADITEKMEWFKYFTNKIKAIRNEISELQTSPEAPSAPPEASPKAPEASTEEKP